MLIDCELAQKDLSSLMNEGLSMTLNKLSYNVFRQKLVHCYSIGGVWGTKYKEGLGSEQVAEAVINKFIADFTPPAEFDLVKLHLKDQPMHQSLSLSLLTSNVHIVH